MLLPWILPTANSQRETRGPQLFSILKLRLLRPFRSLQLRLKPEASNPKSAQGFFCLASLPSFWRYSPPTAGLYLDGAIKISFRFCGSHSSLKEKVPTRPARHSCDRGWEGRSGFRNQASLHLHSRMALPSRKFPESWSLPLRMPVCQGP